MSDENETITSEAVSRRSTSRISQGQSISTVPSSAAAEYLKRFRFDDNPNSFPSIAPNLSQNNVNVDHVAEMTTYYNIYATPTTETDPSNNSQDSSSPQLSKKDDDLMSKFIRARGKFLTKKYYAGAILLAVSVGLIIWLIIVLRPGEPLPGDCNFIYSRSDWCAEIPKRDLRKLQLPVERIIVAHTADMDDTCYDFEDCKQRVRNIQKDNDDLDDIPYNFLIGGDGSIYEGRGIEYEGQHTANINGSSYDDIGICVAFIGTFLNQSLTEDQIAAFNNFVKFFISEGKMIENYKVFFQEQLTAREIPAEALLEAMNNFTNFYPGRYD